MAPEPLPGGDGSPPRRLGEGLDRVVRHLGAPGADALTTLFSAWAEVVGPQVAAHSRPLALRDGTLVVGVEEPAWAAQLRWLEPDLLRGVERHLGEGRVRAVEVRVRVPGAGPDPPRRPRRG